MLLSVAFQFIFLCHVSIAKTAEIDGKNIAVRKQQILFCNYDKTLKAGKIILKFTSVLPFSKGSNKKSATNVNYKSSLKILRDVLL